MSGYLELQQTLEGSGIRVFRGSSAPVNGTDEVQSIDITGSPTGGTFRLAYGVYETGDIAYDADATAVQTAILATNGFESGEVAVTGSNPNFSATFGGNKGKRNVDQFTLAENELTGGTSPTVAFSTDTAGVAATLAGQPAGTLYIDTSTGTIYVNVGDGLDPDWDVASAAPAVDMASLDGGDVANHAADATTAGLPVLYEVAVAGGAAANEDITVDHKVKVIDVWAQHTGGAGESSDTIQVLNSGDAITDAMDWSGADNAIVRAASIDDAYATIAAAGTLRVTTVDDDTGGDVGAGTVYVLCLRVA